MLSNENTYIIFVDRINKYFLNESKKLKRNKLYTVKLVSKFLKKRKRNK